MLIPIKETLQHIKMAAEVPNPTNAATYFLLSIFRGSVFETVHRKRFSGCAADFSGCAAEVKSLSKYAEIYFTYAKRNVVNCSNALIFLRLSVVTQCILSFSQCFKIIFKITRYSHCQLCSFIRT